MISDTATGLFLSRGFDVVKMAEIAQACDVSEKTIYNYFPTKESLLLDRQDDMQQAIAEALGPQATEPPLAAMQTVLADQLGQILATVERGSADLADLRRFIQLLDSTPSLRTAQVAMDASLVTVAAAALGSRAGVEATEPEPQITAQALIALLRLQFGALRRLAADETLTDARELRQRVQAQVGRAAEVLARGLEHQPHHLRTAVPAPATRAAVENGEPGCSGRGDRI